MNTLNHTYVIKRLRKNGLSLVREKHFMETNSWKERITVNPRQCGGRPCIRGMRIRVIDIIDLFAAGLNQEQILEELPDLEKEDIEAAFKYISLKLDHPVLAA